MELRLQADLNRDLPQFGNLLCHALGDNNGAWCFPCMCNSFAAEASITSLTMAPSPGELLPYTPSIVAKTSSRELPVMKLKDNRTPTCTCCYRITYQTQPMVNCMK